MTKDGGFGSHEKRTPPEKRKNAKQSQSRPHSSLFITLRRNQYVDGPADLQTSKSAKQSQFARFITFHHLHQQQHQPANTPTNL
jgi:hypothetical protein